MSRIELDKAFVVQKKKLNIFLSIKVGDKIMEDSSKGVLYIEPPSYFQSIKRWWYGENKVSTFKYLDRYFVEFVRFLDRILAIVDDRNKSSISPLGYSVCKYINNIIPGIHVLKSTYPNYVELHDKIASIIITLIDFKTEYREKIKRGDDRERALSF